MMFLSRIFHTPVARASGRALFTALFLSWGSLGCPGTDGGGGGAGGAGGADGAGGAGGAGGAAACGSVFGLDIRCSAELTACCKAQGGVPGDRCTFEPDCVGALPDAICYPPLPPPGKDEFECDYFNCKVGQVCDVPVVAGDGCWPHACKNPPAPCDAAPTCACLEANNLLASVPPWGGPVTCTEDAAGNVRLQGNVGW